MNAIINFITGLYSALAHEELLECVSVISMTTLKENKYRVFQERQKKVGKYIKNLLL